MNRFARRALPVLTALALLVVPISAQAATTVGKQCAADGATIVPISASDLNSVVPASGVIANWGYSYPVGFPTFFTGGLAVLRPTGVASQYTVISITYPNSDGKTTGTHIPVKAGDRIGVSGGAGTCADATPGAGYSDDTSGPTVGGIGTNVTLVNDDTGDSLAMWASIEPDADNDAYGDETQDKCPQSAAYQAACPVTQIAAKVIANPKAFQAAVTTSVASSVTAVGTVKLPKSKGKKAKTLTFKSKALATTPGALSTLKLKYPSALTKALKSMSKSKKLKLSVTLTATGVAANTTKKFTVKLPGTK